MAVQVERPWDWMVKIVWESIEKEHLTSFLAQNNPFHLMAKILLIIAFLIKKNRWPLDHSLGFHSCPTQTSFKSPSPSPKNNHFKSRRPLDFDHSMKGREAELLVSCNLIRANGRPLDHSVKCPWEREKEKKRKRERDGKWTIDAGPKNRYRHWGMLIS
jgi:hypothetical protein